MYIFVGGVCHWSIPVVVEGAVGEGSWRAGHGVEEDRDRSPFVFSRLIVFHGGFMVPCTDTAVDGSWRFTSPEE